MHQTHQHLRQPPTGGDLPSRVLNVRLELGDGHQVALLVSRSLLGYFGHGKSQQFMSPQPLLMHGCPGRGMCQEQPVLGPFRGGLVDLIVGLLQPQGRTRAE